MTSPFASIAAQLHARLRAKAGRLAATRAGTGIGIRDSGSAESRAEHNATTPRWRSATWLWPELF